MDPAVPTTTVNPSAPEGQTPATASGQMAPPAPVAGEDAASLKAQLESLQKWKASADADLKKYRDERRSLEEKAAADKAAFEARLRETGEFAKLAEIAEEKARALEAQLADLSPKAQRLTAHEQRVRTKLDAAKAKGDLPSYLVRAIDAAASRDVDEAADILDEYRSAQASAQPALKQPAPPAPVPGGAPPSPAVAKRLEEMTTAELEQLKRTDRAAFDRLIGAVGSRPASRTFGGWLAGR